MAEKPTTASEPDVQLITTYRYLRMALVTVLALLAFSVILRITSSADPILPSISDYYWTPVRSVFVGSLVALGVGMIVIKADNELEDIFLNVGGVLAPVVAFVPVPEVGTCVAAPGGGPPPALPQTTVDGITNNVGALLLAGALGLAIFLVLAFVVRDLAPRQPRLPTSIRIARLAGTGTVVVLFLGAWWWFEHGRASFECHGHNAAAITLFVCIIAVTALNAITRTLALRARGHSLARALFTPYAVITVLMALVLLIGLLRFDSWDYSILFVEAGVLALFLAFWVIQSAELWSTGVRHRGRGPSLVPRAPTGS